MLINEVFIMLIKYPGLIFCIAMIALTIYMVDTLKITYKFNREDFIRQLKEDFVDFKFCSSCNTRLPF